MNNNPFQELMDRRLWPIALLLVAALVAVPMMLKKSEDTASAPTPIAAAPESSNVPDDTVVDPADTTRTDTVRSVIGDRKDPFRPAQIDRVPKPEDTADTAAVTAATNAAATEQPKTEEPATGGTGTTPTVDVPVDTTPKPTYELYSLVVSFGDVTAEQNRKVVERLTGLPGGNPAVLYLGLLSDHKTAAFIVDNDVNVEGDGKCNPSPEDCQTLTLKPGETEFFTRGDVTYQLDLEKVITKTTFSQDEVQANRDAVADGGASALRKMGGHKAPFKYSKKTGTVAAVAVKKSVSPKASSLKGAELVVSSG